MKRVAIVMAGGAGERFWPLSTPDRPKQLLDLTGSGKTLLEEAIERIRGIVDEVFVSTTSLLEPSIQRAGLVQADHILAEPAKRNTAGALVWCMAALTARFGPQFTVAITTADHAISPTEGFQETVKEALDQAEGTGRLITIGIPPTRPETGYGYLEVEGDHRVTRFTEKPDLELAKSFVKSGSFLWNSGMFFWTSEAFRSELATASPVHASALLALSEALENEDRAAADRAFESLPNVSIDYALMEKSDSVGYVRARFEWDDLGSWTSLLRAVRLDENGNACVGPSIRLRSRGCVVYNATHRPISVLGCCDVAVVATEEGMLVLPLDESQNVREAAQAHAR